MKLYTREQMIQAFNYGKKLEGFDWIGNMIDSLTPIELPSDEEIADKLKEVIGNLGELEHRKLTFMGALWMKEQIKKQATT